MKHFAVGTVAAFYAASIARGQGLKEIGTRLSEGIRLPFSLSVSSAIGWDSAPGAGSSSSSGSDLPSGGSGSGFWQNAFSLDYPLGRVNNRFNIDANFSSNWYFDPPRGTGEFQNSGGLNLRYSRHVSDRLSFGDVINAAYQTQPDFQVGASISRPTSGYFYASNNLWLNYNWSTRFSTISSWTVNNISYDDDALEAENNTRQTLSEKIRYALSHKTTGSLEYRFSFTDYPDNPDAESLSNSLLFGVERPLGRFLSMSLSAGPEWRSYEGPLGNRTSTVVEAAVDYLARENTTFRFYYRSGLDDTGTAGTQSNISRRTGLSMTHKFTHGVSLNLSLNSINSDHARSPSGLKGRAEDTLEARAGLSYYRQLWQGVGLNASYTYSMVNSDDVFSEYRRHQMSLGISARF